MPPSHPDKANLRKTSMEADKKAREFLKAGVHRVKNGFILSGLPLPLSVNEAFAPRIKPMRGIHARGFISTKKKLAYDQAVKHWRYYFLREMREASAYFMKFLEANTHVLEINRIFFFNAKRILTKDGRPKALDVTNRIKNFDDALEKHILGIDDKHFWFGHEYKLPVPNFERECAIVSVRAKPMPDPDSIEKYLDQL